MSKSNTCRNMFLGMFGEGSCNCSEPQAHAPGRRPSRQSACTAVRFQTCVQARAAAKGVASKLANEELYDLVRGCLACRAVVSS